MNKNNKKNNAKKGAKPAKKKTSSSRKSTTLRVTELPRAPKTTIGVLPLSDRVLVRALSAEENTTVAAFGLIMPDSSKEKSEQGTVVAVGPGKKNDDGTLQIMSVKIGDRVMFSKYGFDEIKVGGVEYLILPESSILAVIE